MTVLQSQLRLSLLDRVTGPARGIMATMGRLRAMGAAQASVFAGVGRHMAMMTGGTLGVLGLARGFKTAVSTASDFEFAMNRVTALSGASAKQFADMRKQALDLGRTTMFTSSQAGDAMGFLAMAGFKANDIMGAMPGTLQLATAAQMDLGRTADVVTNILTGYNKKVDELGHVNDVLVKAFTSANTDLEQLATAMKYAGPTASAAGVRFEEATAALALMGNAGIQGSMAGTSLRGALARVLNPTKQVQNAMKRAGVQFTDTEGRLLPLADIVQKLEPHAEDAGLMFELFGQRAGPAMAALVTQGSGALRKLDRELVNSGGTAQRVADVYWKGFQGRMLEMRSALEGTMIALGDRLIPWITPGLQRLTGMFGSLTGFIESLSQRVSVFDKMKEAFDAFSVGFGGAGFSDWLRETGEAWTNSIFGVRFGENEFEHTRNLARISNQWRQIGRDFRAFMDDMSGVSLHTAMSGLWRAFSDMPGGGQVLTLWAAGKALGLLGGAVMLLAGSPIFRVALGLWALANVIDMFKGAEGFSQFVQSMKDLSGLEMAGLALALGLVAGKIWSIARGLRAVKSAGGVGGALGGKQSSAVGGVGLLSLAALALLGLKLAGPAAAAGTLHTYGPQAVDRSRPVETGEPLWWMGIDPTESREERLKRVQGENEGKPALWKRLLLGKAAYPDFSFREHMRIGGGEDRQVVELQSIREALQSPPSGTQDVHVTNPVRPNVNISVTVHAATNASPEAIGKATADRVRSALDGYHSDGGL